ncbi:hypothetical protein Hte_000087 [Hypoxylon texense]
MLDREGNDSSIHFIPFSRPSAEATLLRSQHLGLGRGEPCPRWQSASSLPTVDGLLPGGPEAGGGEALPEAWARALEDERVSEAAAVKEFRASNALYPGAGAGRVSHAGQESRVRPPCPEGLRLG